MQMREILADIRRTRRAKSSAPASRLSAFWEVAESLWNKSRILAWALAISGVSLALWAFIRPQSPGVSIGLLALAAGIMSVRPNMHTAEKFTWIGVLVALAVFEVLAISRSDRENAAKRAEEDHQFQVIAETQHAQFDATLARMEDLNTSEEKRFASLVRQSERLLAHEDELADGLRGRILPGEEPTPDNSCSDISIDYLRVFIGPAYKRNVLLVNKFPSVIVVRDPRSKGLPFPGISLGGPTDSMVPVVSLDKDPGGGLDVILDIRSNDGKLVARLDKNGFVINRNKILEVERRPDKSSLLLVDDWGDEVLNIRYLNPSAIVIGGKGIDMNGMNDSCFQITTPIILEPLSR